MNNRFDFPNVEDGAKNHDRPCGITLLRAYRQYFFPFFLVKVMHYNRT